MWRRLSGGYRGRGGRRGARATSMEDGQGRGTQELGVFVTRFIRDISHLREAAIT
jgi:hypothetical protein